VTGRARYGDLLRDASHHLLRGTVILTRDRFDHTASAQVRAVRSVNAEPGG